MINQTEEAKQKRSEREQSEDGKQNQRERIIKRLERNQDHPSKIAEADNNEYNQIRKELLLSGIIIFIVSTYIISIY
jgi:hypothetical protein